MIGRYVRPLTESPRHTVAEIMPHDATPRARVRAHGMLLSAQGLQSKEIAQIYHVDRDTGAPWLTQWAQHGVARLSEKPRSGRPPKRTLAAKDLARQYSKADPRGLQQVVARLSQTTAQRLSLASLQRLAKKARLRGKRVSKSCKRLRDPAEVPTGQRARDA
jgi:transposase